MKDWRWNLAVAFWSAAVVTCFIPGIAFATVAEVGEFKFNLRDGALLIALGTAWGDIRQRVASVEKRLSKLEE